MPGEKIKITQAVIVEGKYDKIKLESLIDAFILPTNGFSLFTDSEMKGFIRELAKTRGIVVLTDSDTAGFKIRAYLSGMLPKEQVTNVYIPDILGKEKRKRIHSAEGKLGVEGMDADVLRKAFGLAGIIHTASQEKTNPITKLDLYEDGLVGLDNSRALRLALYKKLSLPERLNVNTAIPLLNALMTKEEYKSAIREINGEDNIGN